MRINLAFAMLFGPVVSQLALSPADAHEFWIEPLAYAVPADGIIQAALVNGENFEGVELSFIPQRFKSFEIAQSAQASQTVENRIGAAPALDMPADAPGLQIVTYQAQPSRLRYSEWEKFLAFAAHKDFAEVEARHLARDLPLTGFYEGYTRFAKSLIAVGGGTGSDFLTGFPVEFVAQENPYTDDLGGDITFTLFVNAEPLVDAQVEVFEKAPAAEVAVTLHRTDAQGRVTVPVVPGHSYLLDHVVLQVPAPDAAATEDVVWETLWASLTFEVPLTPLETPEN